MAITILRDKSSLMEWREGRTNLGLVPTMGALHEGHMSLIQQSNQLCGETIATIFVNPMQFAPNEDFASYPRDEELDIAKLEQVGTSAVYLPRPEEMYPAGFSTVVYVKGITEDLCGITRPGHFDGVCTVVAKLFHQIQPEAAFFGEKDYQQLQIIRRMVRDLDIPVTVRGCPIIREPDGLAMSSRNRYLAPEEREIATYIHKMLNRVAGRVLESPHPDEALQWGRDQLLQVGFSKVDYLQLRDADTLLPIDAVNRPARLLVAARLGRTRLIDNLPILP